MQLFFLKMLDLHRFAALKVNIVELLIVQLRNKRCATLFVFNFCNILPNPNQESEMPQK